MFFVNGSIEPRRVGNMKKSRNRRKSKPEAAPKDPIKQYVDLLILRGLQNNASQVYLKPTRCLMLDVVFRIDKRFLEMDALPRNLAPFVISRLKTMAKCSVITTTRVQHGSCHNVNLGFGKKGKQCFEVFFIPFEFGEGAIIQYLPHRP